MKRERRGRGRGREKKRKKKRRGNGGAEKEIKGRGHAPKYFGLEAPLQPRRIIHLGGESIDSRRSS